MIAIYYFFTTIIGILLLIISIMATGNLDIKNSFIWTKVGLINGK